MKSSWLPVVIAFVLGAALGAAAMHRLEPHPRRGDPEKFHARLTERFKKELNLTGEQQVRVAAILEDSRAKLSALKKEMHPKFEEVKNASRAEIRKILDPGQQAKFDKLGAEMEARRREKKGKPFRGSSL